MEGRGKPQRARLTAIAITPYSDEMLPVFAALHNESFAGMHNFWPVASRTLRRRIVSAPGFDPAGLLFASLDGEPAGFAHGGAQLYAIGVRPQFRRAGAGRALVEALRARGMTGADFRGMNPFWGNARGPQTCFFGLVEGIGASHDDRAAEGFFQAMGFARGPLAVNLRVTPDSMDLEPGRDARRRAETLGYDIGLVRGRCPMLGQGPDSLRPLVGEGYFTAVAMQAGLVVAFCVAFATPELGPGRFGIFALETTPEHRRRGLGSALVMQLLLEMQGGRFTACEVTTVPAESPGAAELYERLGFRECARFCLWQ